MSENSIIGANSYIHVLGYGKKAVSCLPSELYLASLISSSKNLLTCLVCSKNEDENFMN